MNTDFQSAMDEYMDQAEHLHAQLEAHGKDIADSPFFQETKEKLEMLLRTIQVALSLNFSLLGTGVSSVETLFEILIDSSLMLANLFEEGSSLSQETNPEIGFSEWHQDALGNPKQFRLQKSRKFLWNEDLAKNLRDLVSNLIRVRNSGFEVPLYGTEQTSLCTQSTVDASANSQKQKKKTSKRENKARYYYKLRHSRKARRNLHSSDQPIKGVMSQPSTHHENDVQIKGQGDNLEITRVDLFSPEGRKAFERRNKYFINMR